jgi:hypothetical protein
VQLADTFQLTSDGGHLWVVSSLPTTNDGSVVLLNMTSWRPMCDENCVIERGEHLFVTHKTVIAYHGGKLATPVQQLHIERAWRTQSNAPVSAALLAKIQQGAIRSDLTSRKIKAVVEWSLAEQAKRRG